MRFIVIDATGYAAEHARYRERSCAMMGDRVAIAIDPPRPVVELHGPSVNRVEMAGVTPSAIHRARRWMAAATTRIDFADVVWLFNNL